MGRTYESIRSILQELDEILKQLDEELDRLIRAMNPWPVAWTEIKGEIVRLWEACPCQESGTPGEILSMTGQGLLVACGSGSLILKKMQRPSGKVLSGLDFANGLRLRVGEILG